MAIEELSAATVVLWEHLKLQAEELDLHIAGNPVDKRFEVQEPGETGTKSYTHLVEVGAYLDGYEDGLRIGRGEAKDGE